MNYTQYVWTITFNIFFLTNPVFFVKFFWKKQSPFTADPRPIGSRLQDLHHHHIEVSKGPLVDGSVGSDSDVRDVTAVRSGASPSSASRDPRHPRDPGDRDGLGGALLTFGAPSEWWHDSIILGRLSALALRYFASKATQKPWRLDWLDLKLQEKRRLFGLGFFPSHVSERQEVLFFFFSWCQF